MGAVREARTLAKEALKRQQASKRTSTPTAKSSAGLVRPSRSCANTAVFTSTAAHAAAAASAVALAAASAPGLGGGDAVASAMAASAASARRETASVMAPEASAEVLIRIL
jgi:di/tricarboxylate transporter